MCFEKRITPELADEVSFSPKLSMYASASVGGFANYWGQQVPLYDEDEPWHAPGMDQYGDYLKICRELESYFHIVGGDKITELNNTSLVAQSPRMLIGTKDQKNINLDSLSAAIRGKFSDLEGLKVINSRVRKFSFAQNLVELTLADGTSIHSRRMILASGVIGNSNILQRSIPMCRGTRLRDHSPYMIYTIGLSHQLGTSPSDFEDGFNSRTLSPHNKTYPPIFASVYKMSKASVSLITASLGLGVHMRGFRSSRLADFVHPVQLWTPNTLSRYQHTIKDNAATVIQVSSIIKTDPSLTTFQKDLKTCGVWFKTISSKPGQGFHYHDLRLLNHNGAETSVADVLQHQFSGRVICVDASTMKKIGCKPHTLTSMARAVAMVRKFAIQ